MNRMIVGVLTVVFLMASSGKAHAQIKVDKKPAPAVGPDEVVVYTWTSSWGLRDDPPNKYPLGIATHKSEAEAVDAAKAHMARTAGNGNLAVTHYLIEGEPSIRSKMVDRAEKAKEILDRVKEAKEAVDKAKKVAKGEDLLRASERKLGDTIKEYKEMVEKSWRQVTEAKKTLTGGVASQTDAKFREVNGLIDQYNREVKGFQAVMGKNADVGFGPVARVEPLDPKKARAEVVGTWKATGQVGGVPATGTVVFRDDGTVTVTGSDGSSATTTWVRQGNSVIFKQADGTAGWTYELRGTEMTMSSQGVSWTLRKQ